jgi:hypothetical protein
MRAAQIMRVRSRVQMAASCRAAFRGVHLSSRNRDNALGKVFARPQAVPLADRPRRLLSDGLPLVARLPRPLEHVVD